MKIYRAVIENNKDPNFEGRYQVRIFGLVDGSKGGFGTSNTEELPWAEAMGSTAFGLIGQDGVSSVMHQGTWVYVILQDDDPNLPIIIGTVIGNARKDSEGFGDPDKKFPQQEGKDLLVQGEKYNFLQTIKTQSGHLIELDDFEGDERIKITHKTGSYIYIDKDGTINVYGVKDLNYDIAENMNMKIGKNSTINIGEASSITIGKGATMSIADNWSVDVGSNATIKASKITLDTPTTEMTGNANISGKSTASDHLSSGISGKGHTHGGVQGGPSKTAPPS